MDYNEKTIEEVRKAYASIKSLKDERKSISEDIGDEKKKCADKTGLQVKDLNSVFKTIENMEKGTYSEDYTTIAKAVRGIPLNEKQDIEMPKV